MPIFVSKLLNVIFIYLIICLHCPLLAFATTTAKYILVFQGDGMGPEHIKAGGMYANGASGSLAFESFPHQTSMTHNNAFDQTTDSAASASAMATGVKVNNGVISIALPGDGLDLVSLLELHQALGKSTGLVSTSYLTDASPAAHGAHTSTRSDYIGIFSDYINLTQPNILFGGGGYGYDTAQASSNSYTVVTDQAGLLALNATLETHVAGSFGTGYMPAQGMAGRDPTLPTLGEMTTQALAILEKNLNGFYMFIEHEGTDEYAHANNIEGVVKSMQELNNAIIQAINWINDGSNDSTWSNTLIIVLADHETGNLLVTETNPQIGVLPAVTWTTTGHTQTPVMIYAQGDGSSQITGLQIDNVDIFNLLGPPPNPTPTTTISPTMVSTHTVTPTAVLQTITTTATGTTTILNERQILAYPNPSDHLIHFAVNLKMAGRIKIVLFNLSGERLVQIQDYLSAGPGVVDLDSSCISPGIYIAKIYIDDKKWKQLKVSVIH